MSFGKCIIQFNGLAQGAFHFFVVAVSGHHEACLKQVVIGSPSRLRTCTEIDGPNVCKLMLERSDDGMDDVVLHRQELIEWPV